MSHRPHTEKEKDSGLRVRLRRRKDDEPLSGAFGGDEGT